MSGDPAKKEGLRERKRRETLQRIAEVGLKLFSEHGYEATTLEAIAEAAGIPPRTFFYYFKTKDEVLQFWQAAASPKRWPRRSWRNPPIKCRYTPFETPSSNCCHTTKTRNPLSLIEF